MSTQFVRNISIPSLSVQSNSSNENNSVQRKHILIVKNIYMSNNAVQYKYAVHISERFNFK